MNLVSLENNKSLTITRRPFLNNGQRGLYRLLTEKLENNTALTLPEITGLWVELVCKCKVNGVPSYWDVWANPYKTEDGVTKHKGGLMSLPEKKVNNYAIIWFTRTLGALVMKGLLKIIPQIKIDELCYLNKQ